MLMGGIALALVGLCLGFLFRARVQGFLKA